MNDLMTLIQNRRSVRKYEQKPVSDDMLEQVLESVRWAPSWANTQCWEVIAVRDAAIKEQLQASLPPKGNPAYKAMVNAPVVLVLCAKLGVSGYHKGNVTTKFGEWMMYDLGIATQNICLTAYSLGLGTVVVGLFDHDKAAQVIQMPDGYELVSMIPMGYPAKSGSAPARKAIREFTHYEKWQSK
ncbi:MAG: nitroreductase [Desulfobacteraceae bacterium]|nr:nitroreductase [Desulfobacteraceae bacterium]